MKHKRINLLKHPVASQLLKYKWKTYGLPVFVISFLLHLFFITLLTVMVLLTPLPQRKECRGKFFCDDLSSQYTNIVTLHPAIALLNQYQDT